MQLPQQHTTCDTQVVFVYRWSAKARQHSSGHYAQICYAPLLVFPMPTGVAATVFPDDLVLSAIVAYLHSMQVDVFIPVHSVHHLRRFAVFLPSVPCRSLPGLYLPCNQRSSRTIYFFKYFSKLSKTSSDRAYKYSSFLGAGRWRVLWSLSQYQERHMRVGCDEREID